MEHPEGCKSTQANPEEIAVMKDMLKEFSQKGDDVIRQEESIYKI